MTQSSRAGVSAQGARRTSGMSRPRRRAPARAELRRPTIRRVCGPHSSGRCSAAASICRAWPESLREEGVPAGARLPARSSRAASACTATSHAGAVGPWQFVRGTGQRYGLRIDGYVDERRDPEKATRAAARYLRDLYERFGDWHLALAGYNTGEGNIERIQNWKGCENFWEMSDRGYLPNETSEFVPRFLAAVEVAKSPEDYGFDVPTTPPTRFDTIEVTRPISLKAVAQLSGSDEETHQRAQPGAQPRRRAAAGLSNPPAEGHARAVRGRARLLSRAREADAGPARGRARYTVRRGETLGRIASRYGVQRRDGADASANGLRSGSS